MCLLIVSNFSRYLDLINCSRILYFIVLFHSLCDCGKKLLFSTKVIFVECSKSETCLRAPPGVLVDQMCRKSFRKSIFAVESALR